MALCGEPPLSGDEFAWYFMDDPAGRTDIADEYPIGECGELHYYDYCDSDCELSWSAARNGDRASGGSSDGEEDDQLRKLAPRRIKAAKRPASVARTGVQKFSAVHASTSRCGETAAELPERMASRSDLSAVVTPPLCSSNNVLPRRLRGKQSVSKTTS